MIRREFEDKLYEMYNDIEQFVNDSLKEIPELDETGEWDGKAIFLSSIFGSLVLDPEELNEAYFDDEE
jgi:hypothetical protein